MGQYMERVRHGKTIASLRNHAVTIFEKQSEGTLDDLIVEFNKLDDLANRNVTIPRWEELKQQVRLFHERFSLKPMVQSSLQENMTKLKD